MLASVQGVANNRITPVAQSFEMFMGVGAIFCVEINGGNEDMTNKHLQDLLPFHNNDSPEVNHLCSMIEMASMISCSSVAEKNVGRTHDALKGSIFSVALSAQGYPRLSPNATRRLGPMPSHLSSDVKQHIPKVLVLYTLPVSILMSDTQTSPFLFPKQVVIRS
ncbi:hypothetical protein OCU04_008428 [Sclerotinia nivalis]|uniref:Uncharacterized protein n=1 Tax=Sclerotinia nivalis TaxID=352851 RepID=A0A9X0AIA3_9HELO|nr:hypothetical protein OCU04_008428 [Sclerotinia nivalis]